MLKKIKQSNRKMNNKGFSLVELIIVIAIMAILVGVLAPQLLKYIEKTNVSADVQLADAVKSAVQTGIMDPEVIADSGAQTWLGTAANLNTPHSLSTFEGISALGPAIFETLGVADAAAVEAKLKSFGTKEAACDIEVTISSTNAVKVEIKNTDSTGKKNTANPNIIVQ